MILYNITAASSESTVVAEYIPEASRSDACQSEAALEKEFIRLLRTQGYEYLTIHDEAALITNLRTQLEALNNYQFTDSEWEQFFHDCIANANDGIVEKTRRIQADHIQNLWRDNGSTKNITLIDKKNIHNNRLQVINQYEVGTEAGANHDNRYDVTILVNGLSLIHVELKRRGAAIREAFNQIKRYQRDSFWAGSGKTLTSFKTAQLASQLPYIDKVLFVVDRKDLDYQTMKEYDRFEKGAANSSKSTAVLHRQLEDAKSRIIITTIQKLDNFITKNKSHAVYVKHCVIIFDECHRSQFGDMHAKIIKAFKNYHLFGFTGTPIFAKNAVKGKHLELLTTPQTFGDQLHTYTIVDAINDGNVLPFRIDYVDTVRKKDDIQDKDVRAIDIEKAMGAPERVAEIVKYILEHFDQKTRRSSYYSLKGQRMAGFNSIFAVSSIQSDWRRYVSEQEEADLTEIISAENLKPEETRKFMENAFRDGAVKTTGTDIDKLLPPVSRFGGGSRARKKQSVIEKFKAFFEKYFGLGIADFFSG